MGLFSVKDPMRSPHFGRINRAKTVNFTFDGKRYQGFEGDTLASALIANGVHLVGRSFKYHRPRGIMAAGSEEANALGTCWQGAFAEPNLRATQVEIYEGLYAESQNRFPVIKSGCRGGKLAVITLFPSWLLLQNLYVASLFMDDL